MTNLDMQDMKPLPDSFTTVDSEGRESFTTILGQKPPLQPPAPLPISGLVEMKSFADYDILPDFIQSATELPKEFRPKFNTVLDSMMRQHNWIFSLFDQPFNYNELPPNAVNYDPLKDENVPLEYFRDVMYSKSPYESQLLIEHRNKRDEDRRIIAESSLLSNIAAGGIAGVLDPFALLFYGKIKYGASILSGNLKTAGSFGLANAKAIGAGELILHAMQPERTIDESLKYIAVGGLLGGLVGSYIGGRNAAAKNVLDDLENAINSGQMDVPQQFNTTTTTTTGRNTKTTTTIYNMPDSIPGSKRFARDPKQTPQGPFAPDKRRTTKASASTASRPMPKSGNDPTWKPLDSAQAFMSPGYRVLASPFKSASMFAEQLVELAGKRIDGRKSQIAVETLQKQHMYQLISARSEMTKLYHNYRLQQSKASNNVKQKESLADWVEPPILSEVRQRFSRATGVGENPYMTPGEFRVAVTSYARKGKKQDGAFVEPEVKQGAKIARKIFDYYKDEAIAAKLLNSNEVVDGYITRIYNQFEVKQNRSQFIKDISNWQRDNPFNPVTGKPTTVLSTEQLQKATDKIIERGRNLDGLEANSLKGVFKARSIDVPDEIIAKYLVNDIDDILTQYVKMVSNDIEMAKKFGNVDMSLQITAIKKEANTLISKAKTQKEKNDLAKRLANDIEALSAMRDIMRGTYGLAQDPYAITSRTARVALEFNNYVSLGGATFASLADSGRVVMVNGLTDTFKVLRLQVKDYKTWKSTVAENQLSGTGTDLHLQSTVLQLAGMQNLPPRFSRPEKITGYLSNAYFMFNLLSPWNHWIKNVTGTVIQHKLVGDALLLTGRKSGSKIKAQERFNKGGLSQADATYIATQWEKHGDVVQGVNILNTHLWDNAPRLRNLRAAIAKDVDTTIVTPSAGDMPLWAHNQWGRLAAQYKSFSIAAANKVLIPALQYKDSHQLMGLLMMVYIGGTVSSLRSKMNNAPGPENVEQFVVDGIDQSGVLGWFFQANNMLEAVSDNEIGLRPTLGQSPPYGTSTSWKLGQAAPVLGQATKIGQIAEDVVLGETDYHTWRKAKSFSPLHKHFLWRLGELGRQKTNLEKVNDNKESISVGSF
tara:strand:- start:78 stop:3398 length:3321 start_codon:yes stop_codon:yes gene_type:complete